MSRQAFKSGAQLSRRSALATPFALAGCATAGPYFGKTTPPRSQRLVYSNGEEPASLDPAQSVGASSEIIMSALLDSLTCLDPLTLEPSAGLATHYEIDSHGLRYTFYLRGHANPRGIRLPDTDLMSPLSPRGRHAPPDRTPALWSDGLPVTAHDFVYSWRRFVNPATAAPMASYLAPVGNAEMVVNGSKPPDSLAVRAADDFAFQFDLAAPAPYFLKLLWQPFLAAVPRQAIDTARLRGRESSWTEAGHYVSSGPFVLREWRPYDRIVVTRNSRYWEARSVALEEIVFLPISNGTTNVNLYRAGGMQSMDPRLIPPPLIPALVRKKDFVTAPALRTFWLLLNLTTPPLDRPAVRYALNLATDKRAIAKFLGAGQQPANGIVPPMDGYPHLTRLPFSIHRRELNILGFDPRGARELLRAEGIGELNLSMTIPALPNVREIAVIVQRQWREYAGVALTLSEQGAAEWLQQLIDKRYAHLTQDSWTARCSDPGDYLNYFGPPHYSTWIDATFDQAFARGNTILDSAQRMKALSECEAKLMRAMPVIPLFHDSWTYLEAPYLRGLRPNPFAAPQFKYAWIDTNWRPS